MHVLCVFFFSSRRRHTRCALVTGVQTCALPISIAAILAAANHEFGQHGLEGASMENLARRCGKKKQLIYHYYGSKELLFADVVSKNHQHAVAELIANDYEGLDHKAALRKFLLNIVAQYQRFPECRSEEHTYKLQPLIRSPNAVIC